MNTVLTSLPPEHSGFSLEASSVCSVLDFEGSPVSARVYMRRRLVSLLLVIAAVVGISCFGAELIGHVTGNPAISRAGATEEQVFYVVQPGDSLWGIAQSVTPAGVDIRDTVDRLAEEIGGALLKPGQRILLP